MDQPVAIITGAGRGIGQATASELAKRGYALSLLARSVDELQQTAASITGPTRVCRADVSRSDDVQQAVQDALTAFGRIDAVVHCAGAAPMMPLASMSDDDWHAVIDTNLSAAFYLARACWQAFRARKSSSMVLISSLAARDPFPGFVAYGSAKAAVNLFAQALAKEGREIGLRVHAVAPGAVETRMFRGLFTPEQFPTERALRPEQVAKVVADCVAGHLAITCGETLYIHQTL